MVLLPAALLTLLFLPHTLLWLGVVATFYRAGNGIMTIVRGIAVAELLGRAHYGALNGALTIPTTVAKALAPVAAATIWSATGDPSLDAMDHAWERTPRHRGLWVGTLRGVT